MNTPRLVDRWFLLGDAADTAGALSAAGDLVADDGAERTALGSWTLRYAGNWPFCREEDADGVLVILGRYYHVDDACKFPESGPDVARKLLQAFNRTIDEAAERLRYLGGAHVLFYLNKRSNDLLVFNDATGMESVTYDRHGHRFLASSHPWLIGNLRGYQAGALARYWRRHPVIGQGGAYMPSNRTAYDEVRQLVPNHYLSVQERRLHRFYPRESLGPEIGVDEAAERMAAYLKSVASWYAENVPLMMSISGGLDSRLTLAAMLPHLDKVPTFTYLLRGNRIHREDVEHVKLLAEHVPMDWRVITLDRHVKRDPVFFDRWQEVTQGISSEGSMQFAFHLFWPRGKDQLRSNLLEIGRGFYLKNRALLPNKFNAARLSRLFRVATAPKFEHYFEEYIRETNFVPDALQGRHYTDMFYWEHRMGIWHGQLVRGVKETQFNHVLFNQRWYLEQMLRVPLEQRITGVTVWRAMDMLAPGLADLPIYSGSKVISRPS